MTAVMLAISMCLAAAAPADSASAEKAASPVRVESVLGQQLRPGAWGLVRLEGGSFTQTVRGAVHEVRSGTSAGGERRAAILPVRPLEGATTVDGLVASGELRLVAVLGRLALPSTAPACFASRAIQPAELPEWPAAYEGLDLLVIGELDGARLSAPQKQALRAWFRAGGKVFIASASARAELCDLFFRPETSSAQPGAQWNEWKKLSGAADSDVLAWSGEGDSRAPLVVRFRTGFGRGAYLWPAAWSPEESQAAWEAYQKLLDSPRQAPLVAALDRPLYEDFPSLAPGLFGAGSALRWALGVALFVGVAGAIFWRRGRPWRFAFAAGSAAVVSALAIGFFVRPPEGRALSVRIDEFSPDGAGVRSRELLYLERTGRGFGASVRAAPGVLPSVVLSQWEEAGDFSSHLVLPAPGTGEGALLSGLELGPGGLFVGAGPLPAVTAIPARPEGARSLVGLRREASIKVIADCLSAPGGRARPEAERLAAWVWRGLESRGLVGGAVGVYVCRLEDEPAALAPEGRVLSERLGRLGIFVSEGG